MRYVFANWKQHKTLDEAISWCEEFVRLSTAIDFTKVTPVVCPPAPFLAGMQSHQFYLGVQDISSFTDGAHTGFVGANQVKQLCKYAIVGHSERQEPRGLVLEKAVQCIHFGLVPVVCFKSESDYRIIDGAIYALEDPQNISVGGVYKPKSVQEVVSLVNTARRFFGDTAEIIYGGSVNGENAQDLASIKNLNGVLVGNASLSPVEFTDIVRKFSV